MGELVDMSMDRSYVCMERDVYGSYSVHGQQDHPLPVGISERVSMQGYAVTISTRAWHDRMYVNCRDGRLVYSIYIIYHEWHITQHSYIVETGDINNHLPRHIAASIVEFLHKNW